MENNGGNSGGESQANLPTIKLFNYHAVTVATIGLFYACGLGTVTTTKVIMTTFPLPLSLCTMQFGMASALTIGVLILMNKRRVGYPDTTITKLVVLTGAVYALGFVLLNGSMKWGK